jgi:hypothetical protein
MTKRALLATTSIFEAIDDSRLFARWFRDRCTWQSWFAFLAALFGLPLSKPQLTTYRECTGRTERPPAPADEAWLICGRRAGKSFVLALVAVYLACFRSYTEHLMPGERATILIIARDRRQARTIFRFIRGFLTEVPMLKHLVERETDESFDLTNQVTIEIATASFRSVRGYTIAAALCDELAFWPTDDSAEPDYEILDALRPGMLTIPGAMLLCASSPYARRGALWDAFRQHYSKDGDPVLVWRAPTRVMNPTVKRSVIDAAIARDPAKYTAEYLAEFRSDLEAFVSREVVEACVVPGVYERAPVSGVSYRAFVDPAGGSGEDSMTLAIVHRDGDRVILDAVRERQPRPRFSPDDVTQEFAAVMKLYGISSCRGDQYGGDWPAERFRAHGIAYEKAGKVKSDIYRDVLPLLNAGRVELLDNPRLVAQLCSLERRTSRGGKDSIDHPPGSRDDLCNAVAGACVDLAPTGADAWIAYVKGLADRAQGLRVPAERAPAATHNAVAEAYRRIIKRETDKVERCGWCGEGLGSSRTTDGEAAYHLDCYQLMLAKGKKTEDAA